MNNLMGGEAIAHAIIGPGLGPPCLWWAPLGVISVTGNQIIIHRATGNWVLSSIVRYQLWPDIGHWQWSWEHVSKVDMYSVSFYHFPVMVVILSLPDLWIVSSSGSGNGYQRLSNDGMWVILSQTSTTDLMITVFLCTQGPYLSLSRKTVWSILLPPFLQMIIRKAGIKEAARSNTNSSCVCVF